VRNRGCRLHAVGVKAALAFVLLAMCAAPANAFVPQWEMTEALGTSRGYHSATLLANGKVLVAGGYDGSVCHSSVELYDPTSGTWSAAAPMANIRAGHTATLLPNGKILVAGGWNGSVTVSSAELYDPIAGTWSNTGSMAAERVNYSATLLPNGNVLVAGGEGNSVHLSSAELYNPVTGAWSATGSMAQMRLLHTATLLPDGKVLVAGGQYYRAGYGWQYHNSAELYDPAVGTWSNAESMKEMRSAPTATLLPSGRVLVAGGYVGSVPHSSAELYDPVAGTWSYTGFMAAARHFYRATLLPNEKVLVTGGTTLTSAELYDPASETWSAAGSMTTERVWQTATLLLNGRVLIAGGINMSGSVYFSSAELYAPVSLGPFLGSINTRSAKPCSVVTLKGYNFEATQGSSTVTFNGVDAGAATNWSDGEITIKVPPGAGSGPVAITVGGVTSNALFLPVTQGYNMCLCSSRFSVEVDWSTLSGSSGKGTAVPLTSDSGYFWFFENTNVELLVKLMDKREVNGHFWFFWGAMTDVQYTITVIDTQTGEVKTYEGLQGVQKSGNDINAFSDGHSTLSHQAAAPDLAKEIEEFNALLRTMDKTAAADGSASVDGDTALPLNNNRFMVEVNWHTLTGDTGNGTAVPLTSDSGYFWFFENTNVELLVKLMDKREVNGHFWFFWGAMTDVQYTITVTDTETMNVKQYYGAQGVQRSGNDIRAF
jgi:hypothetical protein